MSLYLNENANKDECDTRDEYCKDEVGGDLSHRPGTLESVRSSSLLYYFVFLPIFNGQFGRTFYTLFRLDVYLGGAYGIFDRFACL